METWQDPKTFAFGLGLIILILLVLVVFVFVLSRLFANRVIKEQEEKNKMKLNHQKSLSNALVDIQEKERGRIASDLHDDLVSKLRAIHLMMTTGTRIQGKDPAEMLAESIELSREISHDLMPPMLEHSQFDELLEEACFILKPKHIIRYDSLGDCSIMASTDIKLQFYRIVKEVINNIDKHAQANNVEVLLRMSLNAAVLKISDNGVGFPKEFECKGLGMKNIELRAQRIDAKFKFKNQLPKGTTFILYLPLDILKKHE